MAASMDLTADVLEDKNSKCALKLVGIDLGVLTDEEILESISNYVRPSAIKALFYDSFNGFYVLHLNDIKSTSLLVGKTLQISSFGVRVLPLFDSFVIGNVYMSVSNSDLRSIFSMFGNVFEVTNYHVLPNSSKFFHVLSGTREISFLLPGDDTEVQIPITVVHPPFTFHVRQLCSVCVTQGHSLLNCPVRKDEVVGDASLPTITPSAVNHKESLNESSPVIKQEFLLSISKEDTLQEKSSVGSATATSSEEHRILRSQKEKPQIEILILDDDFTEEENRPPELKRIPQKQSEIVLNGDSQEEENSLPELKRISQKQSEIVLNGDSQERNNTNDMDPRDSADKNVLQSGPSRCFPQISPLLEKYILKVHGILQPHEMVELIQIDARNRKNVISFVSNITQNCNIVLSQLRKTLKKYFRDERFNTSESKYKRKLLTLIKVLNDFSE